MAINKLKFWQVETFVVLWLAYASCYLLRKPLALIKDDLQSHFSLNSAALGWLDMSFLLPYALVSLTLSQFGDYLGPRLTLAGGLFISAGASCVISFCQSYIPILLLLGMSGAGQSLLWPAVSSLLSKWFSDEARNSIFGMIGTSCFIGGLAGTALAVWVLSAYGWMMVFIPPSVIAVVLGLIVFLTGYPPEYRGITVPGRAVDKKTSRSAENSRNSKSFWAIFRIALVPEISLAMFCVKFVRYALMMWLPLYFLRSLEYSKVNAGLASTAFEIGGVVGSAFIGIIVDRWMKGKAILTGAICIGASAVMLILFMLTASYGPACHIPFLAAAGALNCGPDILLAGSISAEIGEREGGLALGVTGVVNGMGSLGTVLEGPLVSALTAALGWSSMVPLMILLSGFGTLSCFRAHLRKGKQEKSADDQEFVAV